LLTDEGNSSINSSDGDEEEDYDPDRDVHGLRMEEEDFVEEQGTDTRIEVHSIVLLASILCPRGLG
jgi:hypothetical protein